MRYLIFVLIEIESVDDSDFMEAGHDLMMVMSGTAMAVRVSTMIVHCFHQVGAIVGHRLQLIAIGLL